MKHYVDFQQVVRTARYEILSSIQLPTPSEFEQLKDGEKMIEYQKIFRVHHDLCTFLTLHLDLEKISTQYFQEQSESADE